MKLLNARVTNFGSYEQLELDFNEFGLTLVQGDTGTGKSTLLDIPSWILYGTTSKNGNMDDVRNWTNLDKLTEGVLTVEIGTEQLTVVRKRGNTQSNDLYWTEGLGTEAHRGKDITDTQKFLESRLGVSNEIYALGAGFNEFSLLGSFFTAKAKDRREVFEKIASLDLPTKVQSKVTEISSELKKELTKAELLKSESDGRLTQLRLFNKEIQSNFKAWNEEKYKKKEEIQKLYDSWEAKRNTEINFILNKHSITDNKEQLEAAVTSAENRIEVIAGRIRVLKTQTSNVQAAARYLQLKISQLNACEDICPTCSNKLEEKYKNDTIKDFDNQIEVEDNTAIILEEKCKKYFSIIKDEEGIIDEANLKIEALNTVQFLRNKINPYAEQLKDQKLELNPFAAQATKNSYDLVVLEAELHKQTTSIETLQHKLLSYSQLKDLSIQVKNTLLTQAVSNIEEKTNKYLEKYFDAQLRVKFEIASGDKLDIIIYNSGYECAFRQLSKGQRRLLTLCFSLSVMQVVADRSQVHFENIFLDEALDGLDSSLKVKAFALFEELALNHKSVFLVDHSTEFKSLFSDSIYVTLDNDKSEISVNEK